MFELKKIKGWSLRFYYSLVGVSVLAICKTPERVVTPSRLGTHNNSSQTNQNVQSIRVELDHGSSRFIEEDDSDTRRDGGGESPNSVQRPMRPLAYPSQQMQTGRVVLAVEVRKRTPHLREVRVRTRHGTYAPDAKDP